jgi:hypothetical protein
MPDTDVAGFGDPALNPPEVAGADGGGLMAWVLAAGVDGLLPLKPPDEMGLELGRENPPDDDGDDERLPLELLDDELLLELPAQAEPSSAVTATRAQIILIDRIDSLLIMRLPAALHGACSQVSRPHLP